MEWRMRATTGHPINGNDAILRRRVEEEQETPLSLQMKSSALLKIRILKSSHDNIQLLIKLGMKPGQNKKKMALVQHFRLA
jgi:hypothetical protein